MLNLGYVQSQIWNLQYGKSVMRIRISFLRIRIREFFRIRIQAKKDKFFSMAITKFGEKFLFSTQKVDILFLFSTNQVPVGILLNRELIFGTYHFLK